MSEKTKVRKDASLDQTEVYFRAFQKLTRQRKKLDHQIRKVQEQMLRYMAGTGSLPGGKKKYVIRMPNTITLKEAIRKCMVPGEKMTMQDIIDSLKKTGLYHTNSSYFYTMVNNKLNRDKNVKKVSRGVFVLKNKQKVTEAA